jgi:hypothetical protein
MLFHPLSTTNTSGGGSGAIACDLRMSSTGVDKKRSRREMERERRIDERWRERREQTSNSCAGDGESRLQT